MIVTPHLPFFLLLQSTSITVFTLDGEEWLQRRFPLIFSSCGSKRRIIKLGVGSGEDWGGGSALVSNSFLRTQAEIFIHPFDCLAASFFKAGALAKYGGAATHVLPIISNDPCQCWPWPTVLRQLAATKGGPRNWGLQQHYPNTSAVRDAARSQTMYRSRLGVDAEQNWLWLL